MGEAMAEMIFVQCPCGREYNAGSLDRCPACQLPSRGAKALQTPDKLRGVSGPSNPTAPGGGSGVEQQLLAEMRIQTKHLKTLKNIAWSFWLVLFISIALAFIASVASS